MLISPVPKAKKKQGELPRSSFVMPGAADLSTDDQEYNPTRVIDEFRSYVAACRSSPNRSD